MATTGGHKLRASLRKARDASGIAGVDVGIFADSRYPSVRTGKNGGQKQTPHYVATVAAWNEFGTQNADGSVGTPERPAIRNAIRASEAEVREIIKSNIDTETGAADTRLAGLVGEFVKGKIQQETVALRAPANAPSTIARKGSSNPLVDTGTMLNSWGWRVRDGG